MASNPKSNRTALTLSLIVAAVLILLVGVVLLKQRTPEPATPAPPPDEKTLVAAPVEPPQPVSPTPEPTAIEETVTELAVAPIELNGAPTPEPTMNPEDQPREFHLLDFRDQTSLPEGFVLDNVVLTDKGFQLPPPEPAEEGAPRFGTLESPAFPLEFPSNAVSPHWLEDLPKGTTVFLEVAVSPDGQNWGIWHPIEPDDDVAEIGPLMPDGRPNPNAGHTAGGVLFWGFRQYLYYRFRVTLSSEVAETPTLSTFHLYYQDSTLGQGHIAELQEDETQH